MAALRGGLCGEGPGLGVRAHRVEAQPLRRGRLRWVRRLRLAAAPLSCELRPRRGVVAGAAGAARGLASALGTRRRPFPRKTPLAAPAAASDAAAPQHPPPRCRGAPTRGRGLEHGAAAAARAAAAAGAAAAAPPWLAFGCAPLGGRGLRGASSAASALPPTAPPVARARGITRGITRGSACRGRDAGLGLRGRHGGEGDGDHVRILVKIMPAYLSQMCFRKGSAPCFFSWPCLDVVLAAARRLRCDPGGRMGAQGVG